MGYQEIWYHIIFNLNIGGKFTRKSIFLSGGHNTIPPISITYSSIVTHENVEIAFLISDRDDIDIIEVNIGNIYINAPCRKNIYTIVGA